VFKHNQNKNRDWIVIGDGFGDDASVHTEAQTSIDKHSLGPLAKLDFWLGCCAKGWQRFGRCRDLALLLR
jgi:hypothetical protein